MLRIDDRLARITGTMAALLLLAACNPAEEEKDGLTYPATPRGMVTDTYFGTEVADPYRWLEDGQAEDVQEWQWAQDTLATQYINFDRDLRDRVRAATVALQSIEKVGRVKRIPGANFYVRFTSYPADVAIYTKPDGGEEELLLAPPAYGMEAGERRMFRAFEPDPAGRLVALTTTAPGTRWSMTTIYDIEAGTYTVDRIEETFAASGGIEWLADGSGFYYVRYERGENGRPVNPSVWLHRFGTEQEQDAQVIEARGGNWVPNPEVSTNGRFLIVEWREGSAIEAEVMILDRENPEAGFAQAFAGAPANYHILGTIGMRAWFYTNQGASNGRIVEIDLASPAAPPVETVPEMDEAIYDNTFFGFGLMGVMGERLVVAYTRHGSAVVRVFDLNGQMQGEIPVLPGALIGNISGHPADDSSLLSTQHLSSPNSIYTLDLQALTLTPAAEQSLPYDPADLVTEQVFYKSADGTTVPMYVMRGADVPLDGSAPTYMYAYGAFAWNATLWYRDRILLWVLNGGVYVQPGVRGGGEYGSDWAEAGRGVRRENTIADYLAAARWLVDRGWASPETFVANGGSASGYLPAVAISREPGLFGAAVIDYAVLDYLRFEQFPGGNYWTADVGSVSDEAAFHVLRGYSPVHDLEDGACYPPTLVMMGEHDASADPAHSRKFTAALQHVQDCKNPVLLNVMEDAGHNYGNSAEAALVSEVDHTMFLLRALDWEFTWQPQD